MSVTFVAQPGGSVSGDIRVPGDKSISHRAVMFGSLAHGVTEVTGFLEGEDTLATLAAFRAMGVNIEQPEPTKLIIHGVGMYGLKQPAAPLDLGNSGTSMRLLTGLLAGQGFEVSLTGDASLSSRPMERVIKPLSEMGATITSAKNGRPPLLVHASQGNQALSAIHYLLPIASAQVKSCVLLAGLYAEGETSVVEPAPTRDHTERMLRGFGYPVEQNGARVSLMGGGTLHAASIDVPADISSAAFFMVAASICPGSELRLRHVGINPTRTGVIDVLRLMGADITLLNEREIGGEAVADMVIRYAPLRGIVIPQALVPLAIDEFPVLFVAAACAEGTTTLTGAEELRVKESDRIQVMVDGLQRLGIDIQATSDGAIIKGGELSGGTVASHDDHRIAMAFTIASLCADKPITIKDCDNVATSFPNFAELARSVGLKLDVLSA